MSSAVAEKMAEELRSLDVTAQPVAAEPSSPLFKYRVSWGMYTKDVKAKDSNEAWALFCDKIKEWPSPHHGLVVALAAADESNATVLGSFRAEAKEQLDKLARRLNADKDRPTNDELRQFFAETGYDLETLEVRAGQFGMLAQLKQAEASLAKRQKTLDAATLVRRQAQEAHDVVAKECAERFAQSTAAVQTSGTAEESASEQRRASSDRAGSLKRQLQQEGLLPSP